MHSFLLQETRVFLEMGWGSDEGPRGAARMTRVVLVGEYVCSCQRGIRG